MKQQELLSTTPMLPIQVYRNLPPFIKELTQNFEGREEDVCLLSSLGILGAIFDNVTIRYDRKAYHPNLEIIIVAPPASGKGVMGAVAQLGMPYHEHLEANTSMDDEESSPKNGFFISGNNSSANFYHKLKASDGRGLMFETELDSLVNANSQKWGDFDDLLRKAFEHERATMERKTGNVSIAINRPRFGVLMSGTPGQLLRLVNSPENGLYSRLLLYAFRSQATFKDVRPCEVCPTDEEFFYAKGRQILDIVTQMGDQPIEVMLKEEHWEKVNAYFAEQQSLLDAMYGDAARSIVVREGVRLVKIAAILTATRNMQLLPSFQRTYLCGDADFGIALAICANSLKHSATVLRLLKDEDTKAYYGRFQAFREKLPTRFSRAVAVTIGNKMGIPESTVDKYLRILVNDGIFLREMHGEYGPPAGNQFPKLLPPRQDEGS